MVTACIPRRLSDGNVRLRPLRILDGPFMRRAFRREEVFEPNGLSRPIEGSWFDVWWWLKTVFVLSYCIEIDSHRSGFVGLYNLFPGGYVEIALSLFDGETRGQGYGTRVFTLLELTLESHPLVETVLARVKEGNEGAAGFWKRVGFEVEDGFSTDGVILLSKDLKRSCGAQHTDGRGLQ